MTLIFLGIAAGIFFGWNAAKCSISALEYFRVRKEVATWKASGRR